MKNCMYQAKRRLGRWVILAVLVGLPLAAQATDRATHHEFGVNGKAILCVPSSDLDPDLVQANDESTDLAVGSGHTPGFGFLFGADQIQRHLDTGTFQVPPELTGLRHINMLEGDVGFLSVPDSRRLGPAGRARDLSEEWLANDRCSGVVVTRLKQSNLFEVKCAAADNYSNVLNRTPDRRKPLPEPNSVVVATCLTETISAGKFKGRTLHSCRRVVVLDGFILDYQIQKDNLPLYQKIDRFLRSKIVEWKRNCSSPGSN
ncbi:MAG: hypothetical protein HY936_06065 [Nitrosomonadales bacterium]|nr:hypothetical protein [Nitrosomonadales bacterium]